MPEYLLWMAGALLAAVLVLAVVLGRKASPKLPAALRKGRRLPVFTALDESGDPVSSESLRGAPAVIFFVRGNWCPFCTRQVEQLMEHYRDMTALGARLVFVTPKPVETTRRVADFFKVEFEYWMDRDLETARQLGLLLPGGVPESHRGEYGRDTIWPATFVIDPAGTIRYAKLSRMIFDRPDPKRLLSALKPFAVTQGD